MRDEQGAGARIRQLQIEEGQIAKRRERLEERRCQLAEDEMRHKESKAAIVLQEMRATNVLQQPLSVILEAIRTLARRAAPVDLTDSKALVDNWNPASGTDGAAIDAEKAGNVAVIVRFGNHEGKKRELLKDAGLTRSGKPSRWGQAGHWHGWVDRAGLERLQEVFPEKVTVVSPSIDSDSGAEPAGGLEMNPVDRLIVGIPPQTVPSPIVASAQAESGGEDRRSGIVQPPSALAGRRSSSPRSRTGGADCRRRC
jgi:hypothetical protein